MSEMSRGRVALD